MSEQVAHDSRHRRILDENMPRPVFLADELKRDAPIVNGDLVTPQGGEAIRVSEYRYCGR
jgi:hypothetical protein